MKAHARREREAQPHLQVEAVAAQHVEAFAQPSREADGAPQVLDPPRRLAQEVVAAACEAQVGSGVVALPVQAVPHVRLAAEALRVVARYEHAVGRGAGGRQVAVHGDQVGFGDGARIVGVEVHELRVGGKLPFDGQRGVERHDACEVAPRSRRGQEGDAVSHAVQLLAEGPDHAFGAAVAECGQEAAADEGDVHGVGSCKGGRTPCVGSRGPVPAAACVRTDGTRCVGVRDRVYKNRNKMRKLRFKV